jgi:hypothetical protein
MHFKLRLIPAAAAAVLLAACGGGGGAPSAPNYTPTSGVALDGYLQFSTVTCDLNDNGVADKGEPIAVTLGGDSDSGQFTFAQGCSHSVLASGGTNADTGLMFTGQLRSPAGAKVISPLTTLVKSGMSEAQLAAALSLPVGSDLLNTDPIAQADMSTYKATLAVQQLMQKTTEMLAGLSGSVGSAAVHPVYAEVAKAFATTMAAGSTSSPVLLSGTGNLDADVMSALVLKAAQNVEQSDATPLAVKTALAEVHLPTLASIAAPAMKVQAQTLLTASNAQDLATKTKAAQESTYITAYVNSVKAQIGEELDETTLADLSDQLSTDVETGTSSIEVAGSGTVLVSFDEDTSVFADPGDPPKSGVYGSAALDVGAGPSGGGSGDVMKISKDGAKSDLYGGVYFAVEPIAFTQTRKKLSAKVYASLANTTVKLKVESSAGSLEVDSTPTGEAGTWSTVTWDFAALDLSNSYTTIAITPWVTADGFGTYYFDNVSVSKVGDSITVSVPTSGSNAKLYGVSTDGAKKAVIDFTSSVANVSHTVNASGSNSILLGDMVNYAINQVSNDFTGITGLRGTYKVKLVVTDLPLRKADGSAFSAFTVNVPTALDANGEPSSTMPLTGYGIEGYITLTN